MSRPWEDFGTREVPDFEREHLGRWSDAVIPAPPRAITWADIKGLIDKLPPAPPPRSLHCGAGAWAMLRDLEPIDTGPLGLGATLGGTPLYGVPVHVDLTMAPGRWEMREGEQVIHSGDVTPEPGALYLPSVGWVVFHVPDEVSE